MARKKRKSGRRKKTAWKLAKGTLYAGAVAAPIYVAYEQAGGGATGVKSALTAAAFVDPTTNKFSLDHGLQIWTPVGALAIVDVITTKVGLQRAIARGLNQIGF